MSLWPATLAATRKPLDLSGLTDRSGKMRRSRASNRNFRPTARRVAAPNHWVPMRGGIRF